MKYKEVHNYINGKIASSLSGETFTKLNPNTGDALCLVARSNEEDVQYAIAAAKAAYPLWSNTNPIKRGDLMRTIALRMIDRKEEIAAVVAAETGKSVVHALGETQAAIEMGLFVAGEGRRNYGKTTTASMDGRTVLTMRQPLGVVALIIASNTPIANVAWKAFPSMFCGNTSIMKPSEDTPATAMIFAEICEEVGVPKGVFNVVNGYGKEVGVPLVENDAVSLVSFTGSAETGRWIQKTAGERLAKVCMELGGKNAMVICDDADLDNAVHWALQSAFSNAGQRCVAASRIIVFNEVYDAFKERFVSEAQKLTLGNSDTDFSGPVINEKNLQRMCAAVEKTVSDGATLLLGGKRVADCSGFYMMPTILEGVNADAEISRTELFGPITNLYKVKDFAEALALVNDCDYGLSSAIHTANVHRAMTFARKVETGVVVVNGGTHGSEPHMGFGGLKNSGTGWREAGVEALDVYSDIKYVNIIADSESV